MVLIDSMLYACADEADYVPINVGSQEQQLNNSKRTACVDVTIKTDDVRESAEDFSLNLFYVNPQTRFFVMPIIATVTILDATMGEYG